MTYASYRTKMVIKVFIKSKDVFCVLYLPLRVRTKLSLIFKYTDVIPTWFIKKNFKTFFTIASFKYFLIKYARPKNVILKWKHLCNKSKYKSVCYSWFVLEPQYQIAWINFRKITDHGINHNTRKEKFKK